LRTQGEGKNLQVKEQRQVHIDYADLDEAIKRLQDASEGLTQCRVEVVTEDDYGSSTSRVYVEGLRPATDEDRARIKRDQQAAETQNKQWLDYQIKALRKAGYKVERDEQT
jgi:hypothetical protein